MPINVDQALTVKHLAENAAAVGISPVQLLKLVEGIELKATGGGVLGFLKKQTDFCEMFNAAAEILAERKSRPPKRGPQIDLIKVLAHLDAEERRGARIDPDVADIKGEERHRKPLAELKTKKDSLK